MTFWASSGSFQSEGSSERAFSSARRLSTVSQSKMPPQQSDRLLGGIRELLDLGAHLVWVHSREVGCRVIAPGGAGVNGGVPLPVFGEIAGCAKGEAPAGASPFIRRQYSPPAWAARSASAGTAAGAAGWALAGAE
ncbi:hypothetical protein VQ03_16550 [Methylobacterium tarhaniae]|uniref:Uncharacterized protein n=1 Tax=Methylobacterium tarhaniae TaxID=1187852 RepID=A0A0J6SU52_9HYPH|nr:hypothetical protein VQ03_16550 [Methylobacterium tarhaniae]